jgi:hypothetical protein
MAVLITALGIFAVGVIVGIIFMSTRGIRHEQKRYEQERRFREEYGIWADPDGRAHFLPQEAPDGLSFAARRLHGVYIRRPAAHRHDAELAA